MERKNTGYIVAIIALAIAVVGMSIGFAFSDINLKIEGDTVKTKAASWDIHFDPEYNSESGYSVTSGSVTGTPVLGTNNTVATYSVTLTKPGDFYEFTVSAKNFGTFDAKLTNYAFEADPALPTTDSYITHTLKYRGTTIAPGTVSNGTTLAPDASDTYTVRIDYAKPTDAADLVAQDITYTFTIVLTYSEVTA